MSTNGGYDKLTKAHGRIVALERRLEELRKDDSAQVAVGEREALQDCEKAVREAEAEAQELTRASELPVEEARQKVKAVARLREEFLRTAHEHAVEAGIRLTELKTGQAPRGSAPGGATSVPAPADEPVRIDADPNPGETSVRPPLTVEVELDSKRAVKRASSALSELPVADRVSLTSYEDGLATFEVWAADGQTLLSAMRNSFPLPFVARKVERSYLHLKMAGRPLPKRDRSM